MALKCLGLRLGRVLCQAQRLGSLVRFLCRSLKFVAPHCCFGAVQADETKAANHIDFTSVPYEGPALKKGQELLAQSREQAKQETAKGPSLQRGWYYSGQLDHMVLWEKGACLGCTITNGTRLPLSPPACRCLSHRTCATSLRRFGACR